ncbi:J domain-containing protein [Phenylobacterium aquaticum]|uniref:J domain-containing protein n=2 Tax=Phenylobacterium aquaticum TaxID=1763816 RepID=UPI0026EAD6DD|nr:J domain-containing protein [Phenylobacterium aquaticum]
MSSSGGMGIKRAREVLRLSAFHTTTELRRAFREAAKRAHPDRKGGDAERFREVVEAFRLLQAAAVERAKAEHRIIQPPVAARPLSQGSLTLAISPLVAFGGGQSDHVLPDGRRIRLTLPAGLRAGDLVRAGEIELTVAVRGDGDLLVRGDDVWVTVPVDPRLLAEGGRIAVETPLGRREVWITKKAGERGLVRLVGEGLPARGKRREGHLFLRLTPRIGEAHSAARTLLRRFAAAWAA